MVKPNRRSAVPASSGDVKLRDLNHNRARLELDLPLLSDVAIRNFKDAQGVQWTVWSTMPFTTGVAGSMQRGWLTFEAGEIRRRLAPIPTDWEEASVEQLRAYCTRAEHSARTPHSGVWPVTPRDP